MCYILPPKHIETFLFLVVGEVKGSNFYFTLELHSSICLITGTPQILWMCSAFESLYSLIFTMQNTSLTNIPSMLAVSSFPNSLHILESMCCITVLLLLLLCLHLESESEGVFIDENGQKNTQEAFFLSYGDRISCGHNCKCM